MRRNAFESMVNECRLRKCSWLPKQSHLSNRSPTMLSKKSAIAASILVSPFLSVAGQTHEADTLTVEHARAIVTPLYESLNEPSKKDVLALLSQATVENYRSCSTNEDCLNRTQ